MPKFSLLNLMRGIGLLGFVLATARFGSRTDGGREVAYRPASILLSICTGLLIYGIASQTVDLWKAWPKWKSAGRQERDGWRVAVGIRAAIVLGLFGFSVYPPEANPIKLGQWGYEEFVFRLLWDSRQAMPLLLLSGLCLTPWYWRDRSRQYNTHWSARLATCGAMALALALAWHERSSIVGLVHIAIYGVVQSQPLWLNAQSPIPSPIDTIQIRAGANVAYGTGAMAIGAFCLLWNAARVQNAIAKLAVYLASLLAMFVSCLGIYALHSTYIPRSSPFILAESIYQNPQAVTVLIITSIICGGFIAGWMQVKATPTYEVSWRKAIYVHETRFFFELLVLTLTVTYSQLLANVAQQLFEILTWSPRRDFVRELWYVLAAIGYESIHMAIWIPALHGLFCQHRLSPSSLEVTPASFSLSRFLLGTPVWAVSVYCVAESALWSSFFYWITPL